MKLYRSHKQVRAARIVKIDFDPNRLRGTLVLEDGKVMNVGNDWLVRFNGGDDDLGYYVEYQDGFASWSPTKALEDGYALVEDGPSTEAIAKVCHDANRAYCETLGDFTQLPWEEAPAWQRVSAIKGVEFSLAHPAAPPSASHDSWLEEKRATGWSWGPVKDPVAKTHPCFVPYDQLPIEQRRKDALFQAVVRALTVGE